MISVAGGAVLSEANRALLAGSGVVVWLRAEPATLGRRVGAAKAGRCSATIRWNRCGARQVRRPLYASIAHLVVDVDGLAPETVVERVLAGAGLVDAENGAGG